MSDAYPVSNVRLRCITCDVVVANVGELGTHLCWPDVWADDDDGGNNGD